MKQKNPKIFKYVSLILQAILLVNLCAPMGFCAPKKNQKSQIKKVNMPSLVDRTEKCSGIDEIPQVKPKYIVPPVEDEIAASLGALDLPPKREYKNEILSDEGVLFSKNNVSETVKIKSPELEMGQPVIIKPIKKTKTKITSVKIKTEKGSKEKYKLVWPALNSQIEFRVVKDLKQGAEVVIPKGSTVYGQVGEISTRAMGGAPAEIVLENFELKTSEGVMIPLSGRIDADGYSLSFWVGLAELATTPFLVGLAVPVLRVVPGGQAVITPRKQYVVYYQER